ncbi:B12-binding domain-containing radical SAM protein [Pontiellaceae bacterium B12219]|nr:B12-binding domain-containing radical SAM protein [Pontiellaceae bacterium B12219]
MKLLLITPPLLQPNTPYAATPLLTVWLRQNGHEAAQADLSLDLLLTLFSKTGVEQLCRKLATNIEAEGFLEAAPDYLETIDEVIAFLQDRNPSAASTIVQRGWLPEGPNLYHAYEQDKQLGWNFRGLDEHDRARHLASLYLDDLAEAAKLADPHFEFSRYAEKISASLPGFGKLQEILESPPTLFSQWLERLTDQQIENHRPDLVALTVPFPGCLLGALYIARRIKQTFPTLGIALGGGYANTELRELRDPAIFDYVDYISLDSGMLPLLQLANRATPIRTFVRENGTVRYHEDAAVPVAHNALPAPVYDGLELNRYFGLFEMLNPVTRLWSDGRWNKLMLAHGCCWRRCEFCDISIDYISRYDPAEATMICDWIEEMISTSGFNGFHFVDESLPHDLLDGLCDEILRRGLDIEWWGNIRFENRFPTALIQKMAAAGCIAVTGGLETCHDRTLKLMCKGITVAGASRVLNDLAHADILTHAYLMYGFPSQTLEETFQALETVRRLFDEGALHSAFWHCFALTEHSGIARNPDKYSITLGESIPSDFARNELPFNGHFDHDTKKVGEALRSATYNYMHGMGFDVPVEQWLEP